MKVLVCGDRNWTNQESINRRLNELPLDTFIIHGNASGADRLASDLAKVLFGADKVKAFPADWNKYGKTAGPIRNMQMIKEKPDLVIAFHSALWTSKGTLDCLKQATMYGIKVELIQQ